MPDISIRDNDLLAPALATLAAMIAVFAYVYLNPSPDLVELFVPATLVTIVSFTYGLRNRSGFAILSSAGILGVFGLAHYFCFPHSYVLTGKSYSGLGWVIVGVEFLMCLGALVTGFLSGRWWARKPSHLAGICDGCGYNLRGNQSGRCSECGMKIGASQSPE